MEQVEQELNIIERIDNILISMGINPDDIKPMTHEEILERLQKIEDNLRKRASK